MFEIDVNSIDAYKSLVEAIERLSRIQDIYLEFERYLKYTDFTVEEFEIVKKIYNSFERIKEDVESRKLSGFNYVDRFIDALQTAYSEGYADGSLGRVHR